MTCALIAQPRRAAWLEGTPGGPLRQALLLPVSGTPGRDGCVAECCVQGTPTLAWEQTPQSGRLRVSLRSCTIQVRA